MKPLIYKNILTVLVTSTLIACSSSGTDSVTEESVILNTAEDDRPGLIVTGLDGRSPEDVTITWYVNLTTFRDESNTLDETSTLGNGRISAGLLKYDELPMLNVIDFYEPSDPGVGECDILINESTGGGSGGSGGGSSPPPRLSGGESLSIDTPTGLWMTMPSNGEAEPSYETSADGILGPIPENATLTIPGSDRFPAVKFYPIQEPDAPVRILPDIEQWATADDSFTWIPSNEDGETMGLSFYGSDFDGNFVERIADCIVVDDGKFEMPSDLRQTLDGYAGLLEVGYFRRTRRVDLIDDMVFLQRSTVSE